MSSAKIFIDEWLTIHWTSSMYKMKSSSPKMEPWGTPETTGSYSE